MNFQTSIRSGFQNYANFKGRASRAEYWWWTLFSLIVNVAFSSIVGVGELASLVILLPSISVAVRRMHDVDRVGWFIFVPIYNLILGLRQGDLAENRFGPPPPPANI